MTLATITSDLSALAKNVLLAETAATAASAVVSAPITGAQKLQAVVATVGAISPNTAAVIGPAESIVSSIVALYNLWGVFKPSTPAGIPASAVAGAVAQTTTTP